YRAQQRLELLGVEEADVGVGASLRRPVDSQHRVLVGPAAPDRVRVDAVQQGEVVVDRLRGEAFAALGGDVGGDVVGLDGVEPPGSRRAPSRRLIWRPPSRYLAYQLSRPAASVRMNNEPVPGGRRPSLGWSCMGGHISCAGPRGVRSVAGAALCWTHSRARAR